MTKKEIDKLILDKQAELILVRETHETKKSKTDPVAYGLHDLLFPKNFLPRSSVQEEREQLPEEETDEEYQRRQNAALHSFIEEQLYIKKDGVRTPVVLIGKQIDFVSDLFFYRVSKAILWKPRGGGGSLLAAIIVWMMLVYRAKSFVDMAGALEQAKIVYGYAIEFFDCFPDLKENLVLGDPLMQKTELITGCGLRCITCSEKQARSKHVPGLIADESCQGDAESDKAFRAAMQITMSEKNPVIVLLSTFHIPIGFFQEVWDSAEEKGFARYSWDVFDVMEPCKRGMELATEDDPQARSYCRSQCPLTERVEEVIAGNDKPIVRYEGCDGRGRTSKGFMPVDNVMEAWRLNLGTEIFRVEYRCIRPQIGGSIYGTGSIEDAVTDEIDFADEDETVAGLDWGTTEGCIVLAKRTPSAIVVLEARFLHTKLIGDWVSCLEELGREYGNFAIHADSSHPYNNAELELAGYDVTTVDFGVVKEYGIGNLLKFFVNERIKIHSELEKLIWQLKQYHRSAKTGQIIKVSDHAPDAVLCATVTFDYNDIFGQYVGDLPVHKEMKEEEKIVEKWEPGKKKPKKAVDRDAAVMLF